MSAYCLCAVHMNASLITITTLKQIHTSNTSIDTPKQWTLLLDILFEAEQHEIALLMVSNCLLKTLYGEDLLRVD